MGNCNDFAVFSLCTLHEGLALFGSQWQIFEVAISMWVSPGRSNAARDFAQGPASAWEASTFLDKKLINQVKTISSQFCLHILHVVLPSAEG